MSVRFIIKKLCFVGLFVIVSCDSDDNPSTNNSNQDNQFPDYESTYDVIQVEIFDNYCINCHNLNVPSGNLILTSDTSYVSLVDEIPYHPGTHGIENMKRVSSLSADPSSEHEGLYNSFLLEKIDWNNYDHFINEHNFGFFMPMTEPYLTSGEINFIKEWIKAGAPDTGHVVSLSLLDNIETYDPEFAPLDKPENGIQIHLGPFEVMPQQETEFFYYTALNNDQDVFVNRVEMEMRSGSHHFILYTYPENFEISLAENEYRHLRNEDGSYNESVLSIMQHQIFLSGTQWPELDFTFPDNVGLRIPANTFVDQNTHYLNYTNAPFIGEVYTNLHFMDNQPEHIAEILQLNVVDELYLPPLDTTTIEKIFMFNDILDVYNLNSNEINSVEIFQLFSHAHEKMLTFEIFHIDDDLNTPDQQVYYTNDWEHPPINCYGEGYYEQTGCSFGGNQSIQIYDGEGLKLRATYYNWTNEALEFGFLSTDEMMIAFGYFYTQ